MTTTDTSNSTGRPRRRRHGGADVATASPHDIIDRLAGLLPQEALEDALRGVSPEDITGPGGRVTQLAGRVIETALAAELSDHLGYPRVQAPPCGAARARNG